MTGDPEFKKNFLLVYSEGVPEEKLRSSSHDIETISCSEFNPSVENDRTIIFCFSVYSKESYMEAFYNCQSVKSILIGLADGESETLDYYSTPEIEVNSDANGIQYHRVIINQLSQFLDSLLEDQLEDHPGGTIQEKRKDPFKWFLLMALLLTVLSFLGQT